jgi:hypothetical protein
MEVAHVQLGVQKTLRTDLLTTPIIGLMNIMKTLVSFQGVNSLRLL